MLPSHIRAALDSLPDDARVLDVGGWAEVDPRADWVIDIGPFETRNWYRTLGQEISGDERVTAEQWVLMDICSSTPWPFEDKMFDYVVCSQTLEDVRDPIRVCEEMTRVGKAGYAGTPHAAIELTRGVDSPFWCGWLHHRWLVERQGDGLSFLAKPHHIHSPVWPAIRSPRLLIPEAHQSLDVEWQGSLPASELVLVEREALDEHLLGIVRESSRADRAGDMQRRVRSAGWGAYRGLRRGARRAVGR